MTQRLLLLGLLPYLTCVIGFAQDTLFLQNPSFEDEPRHSKVPQGWLNGGFPMETPPDIGPTDFFRAETQPSDGETHLVLITRDFGTWERIANPLAWSMSPGQCYEFSIDLARSPVYLSRSRLTGQHISFVEPVRLRIWGSNLADRPDELLAVTPLVEHADWQRYTFQIQPQRAHALLILEAMYASDSAVPYSGNLMLDNASHLLPIDGCNTNYESLERLAAESIPDLEPNFAQQEELQAREQVDTTEVNTYLQQIMEGQTDIGLYGLANYASQFAGQPWSLVWREPVKRARRARNKLLKDRLRGMRIRQYLTVGKVKKLRGNPVAGVRNGEQLLLLFW